MRAVFDRATRIHFGSATLGDWFKNLVAFWQPVGGKSKTNWLERIRFPAIMSASLYFIYVVWLAHLIAFLLCDWPNYSGFRFTVLSWETANKWNEIHLKFNFWNSWEGELLCKCINPWRVVPITKVRPVSSDVIVITCQFATSFPGLSLEGERERILGTSQLMKDVKFGPSSRIYRNWLTCNISGRPMPNVPLVHCGLSFHISH